jgi:hypothetical protein
MIYRAKQGNDPMTHFRNNPLVSLCRKRLFQEETSDEKGRKGHTLYGREGEERDTNFDWVISILDRRVIPPGC